MLVYEKIELFKARLKQSYKKGFESSKRFSPQT